MTWLAFIGLVIGATLAGTAMHRPLLHFDVGQLRYQADIQTGNYLPLGTMPRQSLLSPDGAAVARIRGGVLSQAGRFTLIYIAAAQDNPSWNELARIEQIFWPGTYIWANDSRSLLGFLPDNTGTRIIRIDSVTGKVTTLATYDYLVERAIVSPDQRYAVLATTVAHDFDHFVVVNLEDGTARTITDIPPYLLRQTVPTWSTDSRYFYYLRAFDAESYDLWRYAPDRDESVRILENTGRPISIVAGRDHIALNYWQRLVVVHLALAEQYIFPTSYNVELSFSPDEVYFAYSEVVNSISIPGPTQTRITILDASTMQPISHINVESFVGDLVWEVE